MEQWLVLTWQEKFADLSMLVLFFGVALISFGFFLRWIKPKKTGVSTKGLSIEFEDENKPTPPQASQQSVQVQVLMDDKKEKQDALQDVNKKKEITLLDFKSELHYVVSKSIRLGHKINELTNVDTIRTQMNDTSVKIELIRNIFLKAYQEKVDEYRRKSMFVTESAYTIFENFLFRIVDIHATQSIKKAFKDSDLLRQSDEEYEEVFCRDHTNTIMSALRAGLLNGLPSSLSPDPLEVVKIFDSSCNGIYKIITESFIEGRTTARLYKDKEKEVRDAFDKEIYEYTGIKNASGSGR